jgi:hypothetical protein
MNCLLQRNMKSLILIALASQVPQEDFQGELTAEMTDVALLTTYPNQGLCFPDWWLHARLHANFLLQRHAFFF